MSGEVLTPEQQALINGNKPSVEADAPVEGTTASPAVQAVLAKPGEPQVVTLANGMKVTIQKPARPMGIVIAKALGLNSTNMMLYTFYKTAAWVRAVNGMNIPVVPTKAIDFEQIYNMVGDDGMDELIGHTQLAEDAAAQALISGDVVKNS